MIISYINTWWSDGDYGSSRSTIAVIVIVIVNLYSHGVSNALKRRVVNSERKIGFKGTCKDQNQNHKVNV